MAITRRQKQVLDFIAAFIEEHRYSPSYDEIAHGLELASLATVHKHISSLEAKHYLKRGFNQSRSLDLTLKYYQEVRRQHPPGTGSLDIPLLGRIAAGAPVEALSGSDRLDLADFANHEKVYALGSETTLKRFYKESDTQARLQPANSQMGPIMVPLVDLRIQGRVLAVLRKYA